AIESWWETILQQQYGIRATLAPLDGEYDLNFAVYQDGVVTHVLKVMRPGCERAFIEMQCEALAHIARSNPQLAVPRVVPTKSGLSFVACNDQNGAERLIWLITLLPGRLYSDVSPHSLSLIREVGSSLAKLDDAL